MPDVRFQQPGPWFSRRERAEILDTYLARLRRAGNPLVGNARARILLIKQAESILDELSRPGQDETPDWSTSPSSGARLLSIDIGAIRAAQGIPPTASVDAALMLFESALPVLTRPPAGPDPNWQRTVAVSGELHREIMRRVALASVSYVGFLISKLRAAHLGERQRVARELHDRAAHGIGVAIRNIELHHVYAIGDPPRARHLLDAAEEVLRDALGMVRTLSAELRQTLTDNSLDQALRHYLRGNVPPSVRHELITTGNSTVLPPDIGEELYLILREAVRNAIRHAGMTELTVSIDTRPHLVRASVRDNGKGFDPAAVHGAATGGMLSIAERAELLGGVLDVSSRPGQGTTVSVVVPLPERPG